MNKGDTEEQIHWRKKTLKRGKKQEKSNAKMDYKYRMTVKKSRHKSKKNGYRTKVQREKCRINKE